MTKRLISLFPLFLLMALLAPIANAQEPVCCLEKINLPIDQSIPQFGLSNPFGFTVWSTPVPPTFIQLPLTVEYQYGTICFGGAYVLGDANTSGGPNFYSQVNMVVQKFSLVNGNVLGVLSGFAYGQPYPVVGVPIWRETFNKSYNCPPAP